MVKTNQFKRTTAVFMVFALTALCFTLMLHIPVVQAVGEDETSTVEEYTLSGKTVGVQIGTTAEQRMRAYEESSRSAVERYYALTDAVKALIEKQIDCLLTDEIAARSLATDGSGLSVYDKPFSSENYAFAVQKDNKDLRNKLNTALKKLKDSGTLDSIVRNYIGADADKGRSPYQKQEKERTDTLIFAVDTSSKPYAYIEGDSIVGLDVDVMQAVCDELGYELNVQSMPANEMLDALSYGMVSAAAGGAAGLLANVNTQKQADFTDAYTTAVQSIVLYEEPAPTEEEPSSAEENPAEEEYDFTGKKIGVQLGTTGDVYATDYEDDGTAKIERYNKAADAIQALKQQKLDCVLLDEQPAKAFVARNSDIRILPKEFTQENYALCLKKGNKDLLDKVNAALGKLKEDGTIQKIITNYIGTDEEKGTMSYEKKDVQRKGKLIVATNAEFPPYEYVENGKIVGIDMDIMQAICDELGMELSIENMKFDSIIAAVNAGKADVGAAGMTVTEDRKKNVDFSDSYTTSKQVIIVYNKDAQSGGLSFGAKVKQNFIEEDRWHYLVDGLGTTLLITVLSILVGLFLGTLIAVVRTIHDQNGKFKFLNFLCKVYLTIIRGTPAVLQLLIIYYGIFNAVNVSKVLVAVIAFGLNSAAYVAEVIRSGINAVDKGQFEAGRCLGLSYKQTMSSIIMPQAFKNMLPALLNEFISLLKETAVCGYIALQDLTMGGDIIRSQTFDAFLPLIAVAIVYLIIVMILTRVVTILERRLKNHESK